MAVEEMQVGLFQAKLGQDHLFELNQLFGALFNTEALRKLPVRVGW